jgi:hypothetical protein
MKTIQKRDQIKRVSDSDAEFLVKNQGWKYCSKSAWKEGLTTEVKVNNEPLMLDDVTDNLSDKKKRKVRKENKRKKYESK